MNQTTSSRSNLVLGLLLLAYIFNFLDRQILGILAQPIKAELHLTDTEFGAIGGLALILAGVALGSGAVKLPSREAAATARP